MPAQCEDFSHILMELSKSTQLDEVAVFSATINSIDRENNQADLSYTTTPYDPAKYPSLTNVDVPFFYHCEFTNGTVEDLTKGHLAFLEGDAVYVLHFWGSTLVETGNTYIVGHSDIQDVKRCNPDILRIVLNKAEILGYSWAYVAQFVTYFNTSTESIIVPRMSDGSDAGFSFPVECADVNFIAWETDVMVLNEPTQFHRSGVGRQQTADVVSGEWVNITRGTVGFSLADSCSWEDTEDPPNTYYQCLYVNDGVYTPYPDDTFYPFIPDEEGWFQELVRTGGTVQYEYSELATADEEISNMSWIYYYKAREYYAKGSGLTACSAFPSLDGAGNPTSVVPQSADGHIHKTVQGVITDPSIDIMEYPYKTIAHAQSTKGYDVFEYGGYFIGHYRTKLKILSPNVEEEQVNRSLVEPTSCSDGWSTSWDNTTYQQYTGLEWYFSIYTPWSAQTIPDFEISLSAGVTFVPNLNGVDTLKGNILIDAMKSPTYSGTKITNVFDLFITGQDGTSTVPSVEESISSALPLNNAVMSIGNLGIYGIVAIFSFQDSAEIIAEYPDYRSDGSAVVDAENITYERYTLDNRVKYISCAYCPNTEIMDADNNIILDMKNDFETVSSLVTRMENAVEGLVDYMISETYPVGNLEAEDFSTNISKLWSLTANIMGSK